MVPRHGQVLYVCSGLSLVLDESLARTSQGKGMNVNHLGSGGIYRVRVVLMAL